MSSLTRWQRRSTIGILVLSILSSVLGVFRPDHYTDPPAFVQLYRLQDLTILLVGVPVLAIGLWAAHRGSLRGRLVWLGGLTYMTYMWASIGLQVQYNPFFLVYIVLFSCSLWTLVSGVSRTDATVVAGAIEGRIAPRRYAGVLMLIALGLTGLWLSDILPALVSGSPPRLVTEAGEQTLVSHFIDLSTVVPALVLSGWFLYRRRAWGYLGAGVMLIFGTILGVSIASMTVVVLGGDTITISALQVALTFLPVMVAAVLAIRYLLVMEVGDRSAID